MSSGECRKDEVGQLILVSALCFLECFDTVGDMWPVKKPVPQNHSGCLLEQVEEVNQEELADTGSPLKCR